MLLHALARKGLRIVGPALAAGLATALVLAGGASPVLAGTANAGLPGAWKKNPLGGMPWGVYRGPIDSVYPAYQASQGHDRQLLAKIALKPLTVWTGGWYRDSFARQLAAQIIADATQGNPAVLTQVAVFRLTPWEDAACSGSWGATDQASYRSWVDQFAAGIGSSRVALILQPDLPFAACAPSNVPQQLVAYAARRFNALAHTTVYIDGGTALWKSPRTMARLLVQSGIRHARGFALDVTQYGSTGLELRYGAAILRSLRAAGIRGRHFVVNTDENGSPFLAGQVPGNSNDTPACRHRGQRLCVTLGIPPTTAVASRRWHLSRGDRRIARRRVDAYLWAGRPWVDNSSGAFVFAKALQLAASSPF